MELSKYFSTDWYNQLKDYLESKDFESIGFQIASERKTKTIYPEKGSDLLFKVFREVPYEKVKVVIMGQDPYHDGSYDGLAFSNREDKVSLSPSLRNILREVERDVYGGFDLNTITNGNLYRWAEQGVFLVNTAHTVVEGTPGSHLHYWKDFTIRVIESLSNRDNIVWLAWGTKASSLIKMYTFNESHIIIESGHPSPLNTSNPFKGSKCFSKCNEVLISKKLEPIKW